MRTRVKTACGALGIALAVTTAGIAAAQTVTSPGAPPARPDMPSQTQPAPPNLPPGQSPGESLSQSQGVIQPPPTRDGGVISPPNTDKTPMPVIPPPGTPGGNPNVAPK